MNDDLKKVLREVLREELAPIKNQLNDIVLDNNQIKRAVLETVDTVNRIESNQERQEKILGILSVRSIEHEADINRLK